LMICFVSVKGQESDTTWLKKGNDAFYKVKLGKAIDYYSKAIELNPKYTNAYYNRGLVKTQLDKYDEAIEDYTKVITLDSSNVNGYYKRASSYYRLKKYKEALKDYDKVIALVPNNAQAYIDRAKAKLFLDDYNGYQADLQKADEIKHPTKNREPQSDCTSVSKALHITDNYYGPFHQRINGTKQRTVSDFGLYLSAGIGGGNVHFTGVYNSNGIGGGAALLSASLAYKSHLFTLTRAGAATIFQDVGTGQFIYTANYFGFLAGESVRFKHAMLSVSAGIAYANINVTENINSYFVTYKEYSGVSFPIEFKALIYARNGIGFGLHLSKSIISPSGFNPFYFGVCIVIGYWNNPRK